MSSLQNLALRSYIEYVYRRGYEPPFMDPVYSQAPRVIKQLIKREMIRYIFSLCSSKSDLLYLPPRTVVDAFNRLFERPDSYGGITTIEKLVIYVYGLSKKEKRRKPSQAYYLSPFHHQFVISNEKNWLNFFEQYVEEEELVDPRYARNMDFCRFFEQCLETSSVSRSNNAEYLLERFPIQRAVQSVVAGGWKAVKLVYYERDLSRYYNLSLQRWCESCYEAGYMSEYEQDHDQYGTSSDFSETEDQDDDSYDDDFEEEEYLLLRENEVFWTRRMTRYEMLRKTVSPLKFVHFLLDLFPLGRNCKCVKCKCLLIQFYYKNE